MGCSERAVVVLLTLCGHSVVEYDDIDDDGGVDYQQVLSHLGSQEELAD